MLMYTEKLQKMLLEWKLTCSQDHAGGKLSVDQSNQLLESQPVSEVPVTTCLQHALLLHPIPEPHSLCFSRHTLPPPHTMVTAAPGSTGK